ncbi:hypothetical protein DNTS_009883 [Danionella cerebrum]|uniref:protein acetyllysine N-acetyltransferase n=1 Tax=Danionella cerebrum TaxID=2873325 RepID=A0A553NJT8_9TELE|nr:hypothetical protein DNTS_009883 [Danionella translucida]
MDLVASEQPVKIFKILGFAVQDRFHGCYQNTMADGEHKRAEPATAAEPDEEPVIKKPRLRDSPDEQEEHIVTGVTDPVEAEPAFTDGSRQASAKSNMEPGTGHPETVDQGLHPNGLISPDLHHEHEDDDDNDDCSSRASSSDWTPQPQIGSYRFIQQHIMRGTDPRAILRDLLPETILPPDLDDMTLWQIIINISEPPKRKKRKDINTLEDVVRLLNERKKILVLTGAGVSVSCGIPDFRSRDGIYARLAVDFPDLPDPQAMFDIDYFRRDPRPFFKFAKEIYPGQFQPSPCHRFISTLDKKGRLLRNYTQNIDTLEQVAGIQKIIQCHGSFATASCLVCKHKVDSEAIREDIFKQVVPHCPRCPSDVPYAIMKPDIVFFGENLPEFFHRAMKQDKDEVDLLIVIGSSLKVRPVALIPSSIPHEVPQVLINREPLPHLNFDVELLGDCDVIINELCHRLGEDFQNLCFSSSRLSEITEKPPAPSPYPIEKGSSTECTPVLREANSTKDKSRSNTDIAISHCHNSRSHIEGETGPSRCLSEHVPINNSNKLIRKDTSYGLNADSHSISRGLAIKDSSVSPKKKSNHSHSLREDVSKTIQGKAQKEESEHTCSNSEDDLIKDSQKSTCSKNQQPENSLSDELLKTVHRNSLSLSNQTKDPTRPPSNDISVNKSEERSDHPLSLTEDVSKADQLNNEPTNKETRFTSRLHEDILVNECQIPPKSESDTGPSIREGVSTTNAESQNKESRDSTLSPVNKCQEPPNKEELACSPTDTGTMSQPEANREEMVSKATDRPAETMHKRQSEGDDVSNERDEDGPNRFRFESRRRCWRSRICQSPISKRLGASQYLFQSPNRYIFHGAEVYSSSEEETSSSCSSETEGDTENEENSNTETMQEDDDEEEEDEHRGLQIDCTV